MKTKLPERRRAPRAAADFLINIKADGTIPAKLKNISTSGLCCLSDKPVAEFSQTQTTVNLPDQSGRTRKFSLEGVVVRCEPQTEGNYEVAIFFQFPPDEAKQLIGEFVNGKEAM